MNLLPGCGILPQIIAPFYGTFSLMIQRFQEFEWSLSVTASRHAVHPGTGEQIK
jgi:hypothetical protein